MSVLCQYNTYMFIQKLYKAGNGIVMTVPQRILKSLNLKAGSQVQVDEDYDSGLFIVSPKQVKSMQSSSISPEFLKWLEGFNKEYGAALKQLAKK